MSVDLLLEFELGEDLWIGSIRCLDQLEARIEPILVDLVAVNRNLRRKFEHVNDLIRRRITLQFFDRRAVAVYVDMVRVHVDWFVVRTFEIAEVLILTVNVQFGHFERELDYTTLGIVSNGPRSEASRGICTIEQ